LCEDGRNSQHDESQNCGGARRDAGRDGLFSALQPLRRVLLIEGFTLQCTKIWLSHKFRLKVPLFRVPGGARTAGTHDLSNPL
jgi:hypothetical protein